MTSFGQKDAVAMPERCECGHNKPRHMLAGFDGECIATACRCRSFRPVEHAAAAALAPIRSTSLPTHPTLDQILAAAANCGDRRTELVAEKIRAEFDELRARLAALRAKARADAVQQEIARQPKEKRPPRPRAEGVHPCTRDDCERIFATSQARAMHERRAHDGFDPQAAHDAKATA